MHLSEDAKWALFTAGAAAAAAWAMRNGLRMGWRALRGEDPPDNPAAFDVDWRDAVVWTAASATAAGVARLMARRGSATLWKRLTGSRPPV